MWFLILCCTCILGIKILLDKRRDAKHFPPGPPGIPILGHILEIKRLVKETKFYGRTWQKLASLYGPIVGLKMGLSAPMIIVSGRDAIMKMMARREFDGRADGFMFRHRTLGERRGILFTDGHIWVEQRRFLLRSLKNFGFGKRSMEDMIREDAIALTQVIEDVSSKGAVKDFYDITAIAVLNSLWTLVAGTRLDFTKQDTKLDKVMQIMNEGFKENNIFGGIINVIPFLRFVFPGYLGFTAQNERIIKMWTYFKDEVRRHKVTKEEGMPRDLIDLYLEEMESRKSDPSSTFDELQLISLLKDLFAAGLETTNNTIGFTIAYLACREDVQNKIHEEIDKVIEKDSWPTMDMKSRMPYLLATITEVARIANIAPTSLPNRALVDSTFMGYKIKKGYTLLANYLSIHMDREHWGDPENFRPERFIDEKGLFFEDPWMTAFGTGRRKCVGESMAKVNQFFIISCLLKKFRFQLVPGSTPPCLKGRDGFTVAPPEIDFIVKIRE